MVLAATPELNRPKPLRPARRIGTVCSSSGNGVSSTEDPERRGRGQYAERVLAWIDLEMTGLDTSKDVILEIATIVTDDQLEIVAEGPDLVVHQPDEVLRGMVEVVREMHDRSGLTRAVSRSVLSLQEAGQLTLKFLREHIDKERTVPLCGNSIGTDRRFLAAQLPEVDEFLHYRSIDVSTIKELARRWYPAVLAGAPKKASAHRALDDLRESIEELRYYRDRLFVSPAGPDV
jgi:oligoribonuclease